jgi:hypothetical protein
LNQSSEKIEFTFFDPKSGRSVCTDPLLTLELGLDVSKGMRKNPLLST